MGTQGMLAQVPKTTIVNTGEPPSCGSCWDEGQEQRVIELEVSNVGLAVGTVPGSPGGELPQPPVVSRVDAGSHKRDILLMLACIATSVVGMGTSVVAALAGGKAGIYLQRGVLEASVFGIVDTLSTLSDFRQAEEPPTTEPTRRSIVERSVCWLAIGLAQGTAETLERISYVQQPVPRWQPLPILCHVFYFYICRVVLTGGVMMQAHRDRRPNMMKWFIMLQCAASFESIGRKTPYPLIARLASVARLLTATVGAYVLVMYADRNADRADVRNGYKLGTGLVATAIPSFVLWITSQPWKIYIVSVSQTAFQYVVLKVLLPALKLCFGNDERKLWMYFVPSFILALELGPCLLLLGSDMRTSEFWLLIAFQELNSVLKNTGTFAQAYVFVREKLGRSIGEEQLSLMEERRSVLAPCENVGEIISPVIVVAALALESAFDVLPIEKAHYFRRTGILGGWRHKRFSGETPILMAIVFVIRVAFCWIEVTVRARQRRTGTNIPANATDVGVRRRRSSMRVLYDRVIHARGDVTIQMQCAAVGLFAIQSVYFVSNAACFGRSE